MDWVGMSFNEDTGTARVVAPGGHGDLGTNSVYRLEVSELRWYRDWDRADLVWPEDGTCPYPSDGPDGNHSYDGQVYVPTLGATLTLSTSGYTIPNNVTCDNSGRVHWQWLWTDDKQWVKLDTQHERYVRSAYDKDKDVVYFMAKEGVMYELNPHTMEKVKRGSSWGGVGSNMIMVDREVYYTSDNSGMYLFKPDQGTIVKVIDDSVWDVKGWGLAAQGDWIIGWDGHTQFIHYNRVTGEYHFVTAQGDLGQPSNGHRRVYSKFVATQIPGVFIGLSDHRGLVVYKAF